MVAQIFASPPEDKFRYKAHFLSSILFLRPQFFKYSNIVLICIPLIPCHAAFKFHILTIVIYFVDLFISSFQLFLVIILPQEGKTEFLYINVFFVYILHYLDLVILYRKISGKAHFTKLFFCFLLFCFFSLKKRLEKMQTKDFMRNYVCIAKFSLFFLFVLNLVFFHFLIKTL